MAYEKQKAAAKKKLNSTKDRKKNSRVGFKRYTEGLDKDLEGGFTTIHSRSGNPQQASKERQEAKDIRNKQKIIERAAKRAKKVAPKTKTRIKKKK